MKHSWLRLLLYVFFASSPLIIAGIVVLVFQNGGVDNPIVYLRADVSVALLMLGGLLSIIISVGSTVWLWRTRYYQRVIVQAQADDKTSRHRFLSRLDHELKNPLTAIRAGIANLTQAPETTTSLQETINGIELQAIRLSRLTSDLRKLAELETHALAVTPVNLADLLNEAVTFVQDQHPKRGDDITLTLPQAPWPLPEVAGDWDLLLLATYNLLDNALKFTEPGNTVELRAYENNTSVVVEVADTGPGIPEHEQSHIWEELFRGQGAQGTSGSGLGLVLVRTILTKHGGDVNIRSRPGQGTVFTLHLPLEPQS